MVPPPCDIAGAFAADDDIPAPVRRLPGGHSGGPRQREVHTFDWLSWVSAL